MHHQAALVLGRVDLPQLLDAQRIGLRVFSLVELEFRNELAPQVAARAFGKHRVLAEQFHAELKVLCRLAVLAHTQVAGGHAPYRALVGVEHLGGGKAGEYLHAQRFGVCRQPAREVAQADDVVAFVVKAVGHQPGRGPGGAGFAQEQHLVASHRLVERRAERLPVGDQLGEGLGVHDRAREDMGARLGAFFEHDDRQLGAFFSGELLQADGRREPAGAAAHHDHVVVHRFSGAVLGQDVCWSHNFYIKKACCARQSCASSYEFRSKCQRGAGSFRASGRPPGGHSMLDADRSCSRSTNFWIFPVEVLGSVPNSTCLGTLKRARWARQCSMISASVARVPSHNST